MKSKPYHAYNKGNGYKGMNNQNPPPAPPYTNGQIGYMPSYPPPPPGNYSMPQNFIYPPPMYGDQVQPGYQNYWQYPQYPYNPVPPAQAPIVRPPPKSQKVSLNYNPPKKAQKSSIVYECKTCEKTFNGARQHETHMSLHKKCPECDFEASKKVLNLHIEECHSKSINKNNFISLNTPEEIEKWIADRKKNYPTDANIQRKKKELQEKIDRGEVIPGKRGAERPSENPRKKKQKKNNNNNNNSENKGKENGLGLISAYNSESDNENSTSLNEKSESVSINNEKSQTQQNNNNNNNNNKKKKDKSEIICKYYLHGHCSRGEKCQFKHERKSDNNKNKANINNSNNNNNKNKKKKTLLRMLLDKEIRNEKNKIFQCIRYIINNNFFMESTDDNNPSEKIDTQSQQEDQINLDSQISSKIDNSSSVSENIEHQESEVDISLSVSNDIFSEESKVDVSSNSLNTISEDSNKNTSNI